MADDHPLYLEAARARLERQFTGIEIIEAGSLTQALQHLVDSAAVDLVLLDYSMPGMEGESGVRAAVQKAAGAPVVVMSGVALKDEVSACVGAGARGFLPKTLDANLFSAAISMILMGGTYIPVEFATMAPEAPRTERTDLSAREMEVLCMLVDGHSNKEIARQLEIQEVTVKLHVTRIFAKLKVKNRSQAAVKALDANLVRR